MEMNEHHQDQLLVTCLTMSWLCVQGIHYGARFHVPHRCERSPLTYKTRRSQLGMTAHLRTPQCRLFQRLLSSLNLTPGAFVKKQHVKCFQLFLLLACEDTRSQWLSTESPGWLVKTKTGRPHPQGLGPENLSFK